MTNTRCSPECTRLWNVTNGVWVKTALCSRLHVMLTPARGDNAQSDGTGIHETFPRRTSVEVTRSSGGGAFDLRNPFGGCYLESKIQLREL